MNFQELGLTLQRERETRGLTIEAVMEATKISRINLVALESGDRSTLPHPVYTKGFIKSYARLLGLDADELSMVVDREYQSEAAEMEEVSYDVSPAAEKAFQEMDAPVKRKRSAWPFIFVFSAIAVAVVLLVLNFNKGGEKSDQTVEPAGVTEEQTSTEQAAVPLEAPVQESEDAVEAVPDEESVSDMEAQEPISETESPPPSVKPDSDSAEQAPADAEAVGEEAVAEEAQATGQDGVQYAHVLIIRATTDKGCWVGLWKGNESKMARDFVLKKGEPLRLMFNNPRRIRIGNVAGVEVTYNGAPYPLEDNKSNIQTLVFDGN